MHDSSEGTYRPISPVSRVTEDAKTSTTCERDKSFSPRATVTTQHQLLKQVPPRRGNAPVGVMPARQLIE